MRKYDKQSQGSADRKKPDSQPPLETRMSRGPGTAYRFPSTPSTPATPSPPRVSPRSLIPVTDFNIIRTNSPIPHHLLPSPAAASGTAAAKKNHNGDSAIIEVLQQLAGQVLWETAQAFLYEVLTPENRRIYTAIRDLYDEVQIIFASNDSFRDRFSRIASALTAHASGTGPLRGYLEEISGWARAIDLEWETAERLFQKIENESTWLGKLGAIEQETERGLTLPTELLRLGTKSAARLQKVVTPVKTLLIQLHALRSQPGGMSWQDYLTLMIGQQSYLPDELTQLLKLGESLAQIQGVRPFPRQAPVPEQLSWIMETLSDPLVLEQAKLTPENRRIYTAIRDLYDEVQIIFASNDSFRDRFSRIASALTAHASGTGPLRGYLEEISGWARAIDLEWETAERLFQKIENESTWLGKLGAIEQETERGLTLPTELLRLGTKSAARLQKVVTPVKTLLIQLHALRSQPGGMSWQDYLTLMIGQQSYLPDELTQLLKLGESLAQIQGVRPFPRQAPVPEQLSWIMETLSDPLVLEQAKLTPENRRIYTAIRDLYDEVQIIFASNDSFRDRFSRIASALTAHASGTGPLRGYLEEISGRANAIVLEWETAERLFQKIENESTWLGKLGAIAQETERVLTLPAVFLRLGTKSAARLQRVVTPVKTLLIQLHALRSQPGGMSWQDYLTLMIGQQSYLPDELTQLLKLGESLAQIQGVRPFPRQAPVPEQLSWIVETLSDPLVLEQAKPLLGDVIVDNLQKTLALGQIAKAFPADAGLYQQAIWLSKLLSQIPGLGNTSAAAFVQSMQLAIGGEKESRELFDQLIKLADSDASRWDLIQQIGMHAAASMLKKYGPDMAYQAAKSWLPPGTFSMIDGLRKFINRVSMEDKLSVVGERLLDSVQEEIPSYLLNMFSSDPLASSTLQLAQAIGKHATFSESLIYIVSQTQYENDEAKKLYWAYVNGTLCWQIQKALRLGTMPEREAALNQVARAIKETQILCVYPQLEKLADLLPLLPALYQAGKHIQQAESGDSWLGWGESVIRALDESSSPASIALKASISRHISQWLAQTIKSGLSGLMRTLPDVETAVPSASAAAPVQVLSEKSRIGRKLLSIEEDQPKEQPHPAVTGGWGFGVDAAPVKPLRGDTIPTIPVPGQKRLDSDTVEPMVVAAESNNAADDEYGDDDLIVDDETSVGWRDVARVTAWTGMALGALVTLGMIAKSLYGNRRNNAEAALEQANMLPPQTDSNEPQEATDLLRTGGANADNPYQGTTTILETAAQSNYTLPLATAALGMGIPALVLLGLHLTETTPEAQALSDEETATILKELETYDDHDTSRIRRSLRVANTPTTLQPISRAHVHTQREFVSKILTYAYVEDTPRAALSAKLAPIVAEICRVNKILGRGDPSYIRLLMVLDTWLIEARLKKTPRESTLRPTEEELVILAGLQEAVRTQLLLKLQTGNTPIRRYLTLEAAEAAAVLQQSLAIEKPTTEITLESKVQVLDKKQFLGTRTLQRVLENKDNDIAFVHYRPLFANIKAIEVLERYSLRQSGSLVWSERNDFICMLDIYYRTEGDEARIKEYTERGELPKYADESQKTIRETELTAIPTMWTEFVGSRGLNVLETLATYDKMIVSYSGALETANVPDVNRRDLTNTLMLLQIEKSRQEQLSKDIETIIKDVVTNRFSFSEDPRVAIGQVMMFTWMTSPEGRESQASGKKPTDKEIYQKAVRIRQDAVFNAATASSFETRFLMLLYIVNHWKKWSHKGPSQMTVDEFYQLSSKNSVRLSLKEMFNYYNTFIESPAPEYSGVSEIIGVHEYSTWSDGDFYNAINLYKNRDARNEAIDTLHYVLKINPVYPLDLVKPLRQVTTLVVYIPRQTLDRQGEAAESWVKAPGEISLIQTDSDDYWAISTIQNAIRLKKLTLEEFNWMRGAGGRGAEGDIRKCLDMAGRLIDVLPDVMDDQVTGLYFPKLYFSIKEVSLSIDEKSAADNSFNDYLVCIVTQTMERLAELRKKFRFYMRGKKPTDWASKTTAEKALWRVQAGAKVFKDFSMALFKPLEMMVLNWEDDQYEPDTGDWIEFAFDIVMTIFSVVLSSAMAGAKVAQAVGKAIKLARPMGLKGRALKAFVFKTIRSSLLEQSKEMGMALVGEVFPVLEWGRMASWSFKAALSKLNKGKIINPVNLGQPLGAQATRPALDPALGVNNVNLNGVVMENIGLGQGTYRKDGLTYIQQENSTFQVFWDKNSDTWRIKNPLRAETDGYHMPVQFDPNSGWYVGLGGGLKGGGKGWHNARPPLGGQGNPPVPGTIGREKYNKPLHINQPKVDNSGRWVEQQGTLPELDRTMGVSGVDLNGVSITRTGPSKGTYLKGEKTYIQQDGIVYEVRWDDTSSTWRIQKPGGEYATPVRYDADTGSWSLSGQKADIKPFGNNELAGRQGTLSMLDSDLRVDDVNLSLTNLRSTGSARGTYLQNGITYIKQDEYTFQVFWDKNSDTWRIKNPLRAETDGYHTPVQFDPNSGWYVGLGGGLKGGGKGWHNARPPLGGQGNPPVPGTIGREKYNKPLHINQPKVDNSGRWVEQQGTLPELDRTMGVSGVDLNGVSITRTGPSKGTYLKGEKTYIQQDGIVYEVRWDDTSSTWRIQKPGGEYATPVRYDADTGSWSLSGQKADIKPFGNNELAGRQGTLSMLDSDLRVDDVNLSLTNLRSTGSARGTYLQNGITYIKQDEYTFQVFWDKNSDTWRIKNPLRAETDGYHTPVQFDPNSGWYVGLGGGLKGGGKEGGVVKPFVNSDVIAYFNKNLKEGLQHRPILTAQGAHNLAKENEKFLAKLLGYADVKALKSADIDDVIDQWVRRVDLGLAKDATINPKVINDFKIEFVRFQKKISDFKFEDASLGFTKKFNDKFNSRSTTFLKHYQGTRVESYFMASGVDSKITMRGSAEFIDNTKVALKEIEAMPDGRMVLDALSKRSDEIRINPPTLVDVAYERSGKFYGKNSAGGSITFDPQNRNVGHPDLVATEPWRHRPVSVALYHELLHIYYNMNKKTYSGAKTVPAGVSNKPLKVSGSSTAEDEAMITGVQYVDPEGRIYPFSDFDYLPVEKGPIFSENAFRQQLAASKGVDYYQFRPYYGKPTGPKLIETKLPIPDQQKLLVKFNAIAPSSFTYRRDANKVGEGKYGVVYNFDKANVIKDYRPKKIPGTATINYQGAYELAENNARAFTSIYGSDSAVVYKYLEGRTPKISTKMRKLEGDSLFQLTMKTDSAGLSKLKSVYDSMTPGKTKQLIDDVVNTLSNKGVYHKDLVEGNLVYDGGTGKLQPVDFDEAIIVSGKNGLTEVQINAMRDNLQKTLDEFKVNAGNVIAKNIDHIMMSSGYVKTSIGHPGRYDVYALRRSGEQNYDLFYWDPQSKKISPFGSAIEKNGKLEKVQLQGGGLFGKSAKAEDIKSLDASIKAITSKEINANSIMALLDASGNKAEAPSIKGYIEGGSGEINALLRRGEINPELRVFLRDFKNLNDYNGMSYRAAYVLPEGKSALEKGIGKFFSDDGVQSASINPGNANSWASDGFVMQSKPKNGIPAVFVFDSSVQQKNMASSFLGDHVAVQPGSPLELLAVKYIDGVLYAYFSYPTKFPENTYQLFNGVKKKFAKR
ncbi:M91 family zinc metallopeptidase [Chromobacterium haemolyticum]|uniref:M91 family zinc metallopeptidase n=1 Tax=Chromobacterium haemolyticum TaxID=394935 RepID=UPI00244D5996|nr:M91 family zinc metallopeptidase [Chromobacterium haemolyticum]MDH0343361.1 type III secretion system effector protein [Chromobacterium haemolyticum]